MTTALWYKGPCSLAVDRRFRERTASFKMMSADRPDDGGCKYLWDVGLLLEDYKEQYHIRMSSSRKHLQYYKGRHLHVNTYQLGKKDQN
jgi:hypothetical protein